MSINADYELVDYRKGLLSSSDVGVFDNANKALKEKYAMTGNLRCGIELNTKPVIFRMGWHLTEVLLAIKYQEIMYAILFLLALDLKQLIFITILLLSNHLLEIKNTICTILNTAM